MMYNDILRFKKPLVLLAVVFVAVAIGLLVWNHHKDYDIHQHKIITTAQAATFYQGTTRREFIINFYNYYLSYHNDKTSVSSLIQNHTTPKFSKLYSANKDGADETLLCGSSTMFAGVIIDSEQSESPATRFSLAFTDSKGQKSAGGPQVVVDQQGGKFLVDGVACQQHGNTDHLTKTPPVKH